MKGAVAAALLLAVAAPAQEIGGEDGMALDAAWRASREGRYLASSDLLRGRAFDAQGKPKPGPLYDQWREAQGLIDNEPPSPADADRPPPPTPGDIARLAAATPTDAIAAIVERARTARVVMINEDHLVPRDRAFALAVARALRPLGFDVLAAETFDHGVPAVSTEIMAALARTGHPTRRTGYYLKDPVFADYVRQALALGYRPLAYEETAAERGHEHPAGEDDIAIREQAQADHLAAALRASPGSRFLVHVGFDHLAEAPKRRGDGSTRRWLAARLKADTGIDPLTIDQVTLNPTGSGNQALHALVAPRLRRPDMVTMLNGSPLVVGQYAGLVDLQVAHRATRRVGGRPDWLAAMGRRPAPVPRALRPASGTRLVQAFLATEIEPDAVPIDQVLVTAGRPAPSLMLPPGKPVRYTVEDAPDGILR